MVVVVVLYSTLLVPIILLVGCLGEASIGEPSMERSYFQRRFSHLMVLVIQLMWDLWGWILFGWIESDVGSIIQFSSWVDRVGSLMELLGRI